MGPFLLTMVLIALLIAAGVFISKRIYAQKLRGKVRFRRIRRVRHLKPLPDGTMLEETIVETTVEKAPVEEAPVEEEY